jgi:hypothetical protein
MSFGSRRGVSIERKTTGDLRLRMHRSAFEKEQLSGAELGHGAFIFHLEGASA